MPRLSLRADAGVGSICVSPSGRDAVLAGRTGLCVVDLDDPYSPPRWLPLRNAWEVAKVQWCPDPGRPTWVVSSSNQKALVWNLALPSNKAIEYVLHGHRRAVTDIDFSPHRPEMLVTASIDATAKVWDLRSPEATAMTFAEFSSGTLQAKWSLTNPHQLASAHSNRIVVWDDRNANKPVAQINRAHTAECNGLQYLPGGRLLSCSTDRTLKIWDVDDVSDQLKLTVQANFPIWRAIITPYELGCHVVPLRGGQNNVSLINLAVKGTDRISLDDVVIDKLPHPAPVKDILYRRSNTSRASYDVVTWCRDDQLRDWDNDKMMNLPHAFSAAGCKDDPPPPIPDRTHSYNTDEYDNSRVKSAEFFDLPSLRKQEDYQGQFGELEWIAGVRLSGNQPMPAQQQSSKSGSVDENAPRLRSASALSHEIIAASTKFPKVEFVNVSIPNGTCELILQGPWGQNKAIVTLRPIVSFPADYPSSPLEFELDDSQLESSVLIRIHDDLDTAASELARHNVPALEFCVRYLVGDSVSLEDALAIQDPVPDFLDPGHYDEALVSSSGSDSDASEEMTRADVLENLEQLGQLDDVLNDLDPDLREIDRIDQLGQYDQLGFTNADHGVENINTSSHIYSVPLPKNSGAVWSRSGKLVCFFNKKTTGKEKGLPLPLGKVFAEESPDKDDEDPFAASDSDEFGEGTAPMLNAANWSVAAAQLTANFGANPRTTRSRTVTSVTSTENVPTSRQQNHDVVFMDFEHLWPCRPDVAREYRCDIYGQPLEMASHNAEVAAKYGLRDEEYFWRLITAWVSVEAHETMPQLPTSASGDEYRLDWGGGHLGLRNSLSHIATYLEQQGKYQILACMSCVFTSLRIRKIRRLKSMNSKAVEEGRRIRMQAGKEVLYQILNTGDAVPVAQRVRAEENDDEAFSPSRDQNSVWESSVATNASESWLPDIELATSQSTTRSTLGANQSLRPVTPFGRPSSQATPGNSYFTSPSAGPMLSPMWNGTGTAALGHNNGSSALSSASHLSTENTGPIISIEVVNTTMSDLARLRDGSEKSRNGLQTSGPNFAMWAPRLMRYRLYYASLLYEWGLDIKHAEVSKLNFDDPLIELSTAALSSELGEDKWFEIETKSRLMCGYCDTPVRRLFSHCDHCRHAMHQQCAESWWTTEDECPTACGCKCKQYVSLH